MVASQERRFLRYPRDFSGGKESFGDYEGEVLISSHMALGTTTSIDGSPENMLILRVSISEKSRGSMYPHSKLRYNMELPMIRSP